MLNWLMSNIDDRINDCTSIATERQSKGTNLISNNADCPDILLSNYWVLYQSIKDFRSHISDSARFSVDRSVVYSVFIYNRAFSSAKIVQMQINSAIFIYFNKKISRLKISVINISRINIKDCQNHVG
jgi:hypothetical protein